MQDKKRDAIDRIVAELIANTSKQNRTYKSNENINLEFKSKKVLGYFIERLLEN
jgi:CRISPR/Cas system-associated endonuclease Cas1